MAERNGKKLWRFFVCRTFIVVCRAHCNLKWLEYNSKLLYNSTSLLPLSNSNKKKELIFMKRWNDHCDKAIFLPGISNSNQTQYALFAAFQLHSNTYNGVHFSYRKNSWRFHVIQLTQAILWPESFIHIAYKTYSSMHITHVLPFRFARFNLFFKRYYRVWCISFQLLLRSLSRSITCLVALSISSRLFFVRPLQFCLHCKLISSQCNFSWVFSVYVTRILLSKTKNSLQTAQTNRILRNSMRDETIFHALAHNIFWGQINKLWL